ncbi:MAG TPA: AAA family ATPase [Kofleriaceae bacterium]|nr:AAA family ATPase [Kofleriaceae bacterium]
MVTLGQIRGQARAVDQLRRAIAQGRVPHAYLFTGPPGSGKATAALALAAAMNCERAPGEGCGECEACDRIGRGIHPDVVTLERQGASHTVPIETIRKQVIPVLGLAPHEALARFFLIEEATALLDPAANALLKTLEEPPARTHFVLCTSSIHELLPTIRSRCQRVIFQPLAAELRAELDGEAEAGDQGARVVDALVSGLSSQGARGAEETMRLLQLGEELAGSRQERPKPGQVARSVRLLASRLHAEARRAVLEGDLGRACVLGAQARAALDCEFGLTEHNAQAQMAIDRLVRELLAHAGAAA